MRGMKRGLSCLAFLLIAACAATPGSDRPDVGIQHDTTLERYDGTPITLEELESVRPSALLTATAIQRIERELREPWAETRDAAVLLRQVTVADPPSGRAAANLWEAAEPLPPGRSRAEFNELGLYCNQFAPLSFGPRMRYATLEDYVHAVLQQHEDATPQGALLAGWRRFAPGVRTRADGYLAACWHVELDYVRPITVGICDSLLGPFVRSSVLDHAGISFSGPTDTHDGYTTSALLIDLLRAGPDSPVTSFVESLTAAVDSKGSLSVALADGELSHDRDFMRAVARGLQQGFADLDALPVATSRLTVTFSYLVDLAEARATLSFARSRGRWTLEVFEYQPAAASLVKGNARLDLMPALRGLAQSSR